MGAIATVVFALCSPGDHIVAQQQLYGGTLALLAGPVRRLGIDVTFVDATEPGAFRTAASRARTTLVIAETPANPSLALADLEEIGAIGAPFTLVDSTFATPMCQQPLKHGVNISLHSATKAIGGHNDALVGVIAADTDIIDAIWAHSVLHGATASPYDAHNALRGVRTLAIRQERQCATALSLAHWFSTQSGCSRVHYPGLDSHPQHQIARRQMSAFGSVPMRAAVFLMQSNWLVRPLHSAVPRPSYATPHQAPTSGLTPNHSPRLRQPMVSCASRWVLKTWPTSRPISNER